MEPYWVSLPSEQTSVIPLHIGICYTITYALRCITPADTEKQYSDAISNVLKEFGEKYTYNLEMQCLGLPTKLACALMIDELDLPVELSELHSKFEDEVYRRIGNVKLKPGVQRLLLHLHEHRVPMAIATSTSQKYFNLKATPHLRLLPAFRHIVCGDDPELIHGKPAPDIFLLAASRFKPAPSPDKCLVFEDSVMGVKAGRAAGMQVVMTPDPRVPNASRRNATMVIKSLADFQPELFGLPPFEYVPKFTFG